MAGVGGVRRGGGRARAPREHVAGLPGTEKTQKHIQCLHAVVPVLSLTHPPTHDAQQWHVKYAFKDTPQGLIDENAVYYAEILPGARMNIAYKIKGRFPPTIYFSWQVRASLCFALLCFALLRLPMRTGAHSRMYMGTPMCVRIHSTTHRCTTPSSQARPRRAPRTTSSR